MIGKLSLILIRLLQLIFIISTIIVTFTIGLIFILAIILQIIIICTIFIQQIFITIIYSCNLLFLCFLTVMKLALIQEIFDEFALIQKIVILAGLIKTNLRHSTIVY